MGFTRGLMDEFIEGNGSMIKNRVEELKCGAVGKNIVASGFTINNMVKVYSR